MIPKDLCERAGWLTHFHFRRDEPLSVLPIRYPPRLPHALLK
jgi:hypothetical protein